MHVIAYIFYLIAFGAFIVAALSFIGIYGNKSITEIFK